VYDAIIDDLKYAEATLPYVAKEYGRVTKGAAQHLLAKVYLTWQRDADSAADETAKKQAGDFANAADYAQRVIKSGQYALLPRFSDVFAFGNEKNAEVIWSVQFTNDPLTTGNGNQGHLFFLMEYDVLPGMQRDIANGRPFKRFRPTTFFLGLFDRTKDSRYLVVARFAETYLIAAEALLRDGRPPAEALPYINAVRRRAAIPGHEAEMELTDAQLTLGEILNERARELAGEMQRWFDLVRTHTLVPRVRAYNPDGGPNIQPYHALRPIPRTQMDGTTCCYTQNPGY